MVGWKSQWEYSGVIRMTREKAIEEFLCMKHIFIAESDADKALDMAIEALKKQKTGKWIPCSERKPKQQQQVIITDEGDVLTGYINSLNEWMDFHGNRLKGVIAWMPLPEPYKENES